MSKGWVFDRVPTAGITTQLDFSRQNGLLGMHSIISGRNGSESVRMVRAFTGQSLTVPSGATILMKLSPTARDAATPADMDAEDVAVRNADSFKQAYGSHSSSAAGRAQGLAMQFGEQSSQRRSAAERKTHSDFPMCADSRHRTPRRR